MLRAIREIQPRYVVGENVRGLTNWNGGMVFYEVQSDLEAEGYEVLPFLLPACGVNAPHRRDRIWFVAHKNTDSNGRPCNKRESEPGFGEFGNIGTRNNVGVSTDDGKTENAAHADRDGRNGSNGEHEECTSETGFNALNDIKSIIAAHARSEQLQNGSQDNFTKNRAKDESGLDNRTERSGDIRNVTNADYTGLERERIGNSNDSKEREIKERCFVKHSGYDWRTLQTKIWQNFPTQSPVCGGDDGISRSMDGITFPKWREQSIMAYGNAIVPQVAFQIFKAIQQTETNV